MPSLLTSYCALVINPAHIVPCPRALPAKPGYQAQRRGLPAQVDLARANVALDRQHREARAVKHFPHSARQRSPEVEQRCDEVPVPQEALVHLEPALALASLLRHPLALPLRARPLARQPRLQPRCQIESALARTEVEGAGGEDLAHARAGVLELAGPDVVPVG